MIGSGMIATTLYFPRDLYGQVGVVAKAQKKAKAQIIRDMVSQAVAQSQTDPNATAKFVKALEKIQFRGGIKNFAKNHDEHIWG